MPNLKWPPQTKKNFVLELSVHAGRYCWSHYDKMSRDNIRELLPQIEKVDFRYIHLPFLRPGLVMLSNRLLELVSSTICTTRHTADRDFLILGLFKYPRTDRGAQ